MKSTILCCATQEEYKLDTPLYHSMIDSPRLCNDTSIYDFFGHKNKEPLAKIYNEFIDYALRNKYDQIILVHDDVYINCDDLSWRLAKAFEKFDIIGLAGNTEIDLGQNKPILWHLISETSKQLGCVAHGDKDNYMYTSFGPLDKQALMIDGLFIGINLKKIGDLRFDESNPAGFHFYDLIFSMDAAKAKLKTGVVDIPVIHSSPGLREFTPEWKAGEKYFLEKYNAYTGKRVSL